MRTLYPLYDSFKEEYIDVGDGHVIYVEQSGNPNGQPVIYFHGGPGGHTKPKNRQFFNPEKYHVIMFDQRGCGKSEFKDLLEHNTTADILEDVEKIRKHLKIDKWHVFGGSWGSTLALAYSEMHPEKILSLNVRGIFFGSKYEIDWLFGGDAKRFFPEEYQVLDNFMKSYDLQTNSENIKQLVFGEDKKIAYQAAKLANEWEGSVVLFEPAVEKFVDDSTEEEMIKDLKIMFHYTSNNCFLRPNQLLENAYKLKDIPTVIIQGRYDLVCPFETAWKLSRALPQADFKIIAAGGHHHSDPETTSVIVEYTDKFSNIKA